MKRQFPTETYTRYLNLGFLTEHIKNVIMRSINFIFTLIIVVVLEGCGVIDNETGDSNYSKLESIEIHDLGSVFAKGNLLESNQIIQLIDCIDFLTYGIESFQSCPIDRKRNCLVHMDSNAALSLFDFSGRPQEKIILPNQLGHKNDSYIDGDLLFTCDGNALMGNEHQRIYEYNFLYGNINVLDCKIGEKADARRVVGGVCKLNDFKHMIVAYDFRGDYRGGHNNPTDSLYFFELDRITQEVNLLFKLKWEGWFVQGLTFINNSLYVATNMLPKPLGDNDFIYTGISLWKIDAEKRKLVDKLEVLGNFEPEGLDSYYYAGEPYLLMGIGSHKTIPHIRRLCKLKAF